MLDRYTDRFDWLLCHRNGFEQTFSRCDFIADWRTNALLGSEKINSLTPNTGRAAAV